MLRRDFLRFGAVVVAEITTGCSSLGRVPSSDTVMESPSFKDRVLRAVSEVSSLDECAYAFFDAGNSVRIIMPDRHEKSYQLMQKSRLRKLTAALKVQGFSSATLYVEGAIAGSHSFAELDAFSPNREADVNAAKDVFINRLSRGVTSLSLPEGPVRDLFKSEFALPLCKAFSKFFVTKPIEPNEIARSGAPGLEYILPDPFLTLRGLEERATDTTAMYALRSCYLLGFDRAVNTALETLSALERNFPVEFSAGSTVLRSCLKKEQNYARAQPRDLPITAELLGRCRPNPTTGIFEELCHDRTDSWLSTMSSSSGVALLPIGRDHVDRFVDGCKAQESSFIVLPYLGSRIDEFLSSVFD